MKSLLPTRARRLLALALISAATAAPALHAAAAAPAAPAITVAKPDPKYAVSITDEGGTYLLNNGIVAARVRKNSGELVGVIYKGADRAGHDQGAVGPWEQDPSGAAAVGGLTNSITIDPAKNNGERGEVSIKGVTGGEVGLSPNAPGAAGGLKMDMEIRYAMGRGDSGVYAYAIFSHPAGYPAGGVGAESRFILRLNQSFDWISVDKDRNLLAAGARNWGTGVVVNAKEQRIMSQGPYKNSVEHKYTYNGVQFKIPAYGWSSTADHIGVWFINPTIEYLSGGASKLELQTHYGDNDDPDPIILDYWKGSHYGRNTSLNVAQNENWSRVVGPIFVYVNSLDSFKTPSEADMAAFTASFGNPKVPTAWKDNATALFNDALAQAKTEKSKWPYDWVNGVDYPHKNERGSVSGQLVLNDVYAPKGYSTKLPNLTVGLTNPEPTDDAVNAPGSGSAPTTGGANFGSTTSWVTDAKHYQFWENGTEDGKFTIPNVRPGNYTLHAFADGVLGEMARANITVVAGKNVDLGKIEWKPVRYGTQLWEIGKADRLSNEFFKGDGDNFWLWGWPLRYSLLFPNDITYTIGKSDPAKDWFFQQVPHSTADTKLWLNPEAKDPANQRFGWLKAESREQYPTTTGDSGGVWRQYSAGRATDWNIKFNVDKASQGSATLRLALTGADGAAGTSVSVNGQPVGRVGAFGTNAFRYNTALGVWQERDIAFDATLLKPGENTLTITVPAGDVKSGVVYDYLRLELNDFYKLDGTPVAK